MYTIKQIPSQATFAVRQPVLRPGKSLDTCIFDGDDLPTTLHFGIFDRETLAGVISVFKASHPYFEEGTQYQIRGMAVLDSYQKKGLGEKLVKEAEAYVSDFNAERLWFNARETAVGFYQKMGYAITGGIFDIPGVGPHYVMHKRLSIN